MPDANTVQGSSGTIAFCCPWCGQFARVPRRYSGRKARCLACQGRVFVPTADLQIDARPSARMRFLAR